jgi:glycosyltransferase involved in cell wall biosynthesis
MKPDRYTSIIIASYSSDDLRIKTLKTSIDSLLNTTRNLPVEIIVVDNGGSEETSKWLFSLCADNKIVSYVRNAENMHFGFARNQGLAMAKGNYICIADNDLSYNEGWLEACWEILEAYPEKKIYATPIEYPTGFLKERYDKGKLKLGDQEYNLNMRAGSNCFVMRRKDFYEVGEFVYHRVAGTKWTDKAVHSGYLAAVTPKNMVIDLGFRLGYDLNKTIPIKRTLRNGEEVYFNQDGHKHE